MEKENRRDWKKTAQIVIIAAFILILCGSLFLYAREKYHFSPFDPTALPKGDSSYLCGVDEAGYYHSGCVKLSGWAVKEGQDIISVNSRFVLKNTDTGAYYSLPTMMTGREDVSKLLSPDQERDYTMCGLTSIVRAKDLKGSWHVFIWYRNDSENALIDTGCEYAW